VKTSDKRKTKKQKPSDSSTDFPEYLKLILSSLSPIITLDNLNKIHYANDSFLSEFHIKEKCIGTDLFQLVKMSKKNREAFISNLAKSEKNTVHNCEFSYKNKIFGYSIYSFGEEKGIVLRDITDKKKLERKVQSLHSSILNLQEKERQKLARELHDGVGQTILAAKMNFQSFTKDPVKNKDKFTNGLNIIDRASQELREIYTGLYPSSLRELGLEATIRWMAKEILEIANCKSELTFHIKKRIDNETGVNIFRIVQEIFTNITKHSGATKTNLLLESGSKGVKLVIEDNGKGFDEEKVRLVSSGFGLENIRRRVEDRGGDMDLSSEVQRGTVYKIRLPFPASRVKENE